WQCGCFSVSHRASPLLSRTASTTWARSEATPRRTGIELHHIHQRRWSERQSIAQLNETKGESPPPSNGGMMASQIEPLCPVRFKTSDGLYEIDWRDIEKVFERDPEGRTVPGDDPNELLLTADDCVWLWMHRIGF